MRTCQNLHMHSTFDDGKSSCEEMLEACWAAGLTSAGVSLHSPMPFPNDWAPVHDDGFRREMDRLKEKYAGIHPVFMGIELDVLSVGVVDVSPYDYVIGSVHHLPGGEIPPSVDGSPEESMQTLQEVFGGDPDAMAEQYFREVMREAEHPEMEITAHFDLLTKFDEKHGLFHPESERFRRAGCKALDALCDAGKIFEVNTGAISRGFRTTPYPSRFFLEEIRRRGGRVLVSSDAHHASAVTQSFAESETLLREVGFREIWVLREPHVYERTPL